MPKKLESESKRNDRIAEAIIRYARCYPQMQTGATTPNLDSWGLNENAKQFLLENPNAILYSALFNYLQPWKNAWEAPFYLSQRLGHLDVHRLAKMSEPQLLPYLQRGRHGPSLHRFPPTLTKRIVSASRRLIRQYQGDASNIWPNGTSARVVIDRLQEFDGISQKISLMTTRLLGIYFRVSLNDWSHIDIPVDRHVARVFLRTGLVDRSDGMYSVTQVKEEIVDCARRLRPEFPASLDEGTFEIGAEWCTAEKAYCDWPKEPCPLRGVCRKKLGVRIKG